MKAYIISGAGSGIGAATVKSLSAAGKARFYLVGRTEKKLQQVADDLCEQGDFVLIPCDISDRNACIEQVGSALAKEDHLHSVICNAGIGGENSFGPKDRWDEIIAINLTGSYNLAQVALTALQRSKETYRHVVFVSSILARLGVPHYSAYCASKAGLLGLTRSMAAEFAKDKILVNAIAPGWVDTNMASQGIQAMADAAKMTYVEARAEQMSYVPLGRMSTPAEIGALIAYLTGDTQHSITGQTLDINNGAQMP